MGETNAFNWGALAWVTTAALVGIIVWIAITMNNRSGNGEE